MNRKKDAIPPCIMEKHQDSAANYESEEDEMLLTDKEEVSVIKNMQWSDKTKYSYAKVYTVFLNGFKENRSIRK